MKGEKHDLRCTMFAMQRRIFLALTAIFASCSHPIPSASAALPESLPGGWTRSAKGAARSVPPAAAQELGVEDSAAATYSGPAGNVDVQVFRLKGETNAFELMQRWRQTDGPAIYKGAYFFVAQSANSQAAMQLLQAMRAAGPVGPQ